MARYSRIRFWESYISMCKICPILSMRLYRVFRWIPMASAVRLMLKPFWIKDSSVSVRQVCFSRFQHNHLLQYSTYFLLKCTKILEGKALLIFKKCKIYFFNCIYGHLNFFCKHVSDFFIFCPQKSANIDAE